MKLIVNGISFEVEQHGSPEHPAVLLIMGLGMQLIAWPPNVIEPLLEAGYRVITFDNRDVGLSQKMDHAGKPNLVWAVLKKKLGLKIRPPYTLLDMARDALGVLDGLNISKAHVVGVSMGGMIAQRLALLAPDRVSSLTSIMSASGAPGLPEAQPYVIRALLSRPKSQSTDDIVAHYVQLFGVIGSPAFPVEPKFLRERIRFGVERSHHPEGTMRQMLAIAADTSRHRELPHIKAPTLVLHGLADVLVPPSQGRDTAARIPNARFIGIEGMGHDLPPGAVAQWIPSLLAHLKNEHD